MNKSGGFFLEDSPETEAEAVAEQHVNKIVESIMDDALARRRMLTLQELMDMNNPTPRYEQFFPEVHAYFYTIDGMLNGEVLKGAMLAGHCILVFAPSREAASEIASSGLLDTVRFANDYANSDDAYLEAQSARAANSGLVTSSGGRRTH